MIQPYYPPCLLEYNLLFHYTLLQVSCKTIYSISQMLFLSYKTVFIKNKKLKKSLFSALISLSRLLRTSFKVLACSLLSLDIPLFSRLSPWFQVKEKDLISTVFPLYKVFIFSLFYSFPRLKIFAP